ncbi:MAG TPA: hypothetical protein VIJ51_05830 [Solirubrobacteraceae bacterium]
MTGFDQLERQLRRTVARRAVRRRRVPLVRTLSIAAAVVVAAAAVAAAATGVIGGGSGQGVGNLLDAVSAATQHFPVCRFHVPSHQPSDVTDAPASPLAEQAFPALRRAPSAYERAIARKYGGYAGRVQVLAGGARDLHTADGERFLLIVTAGFGNGLMPGLACYPLKQTELARLAPQYSPVVVAAAGRFLDQEAAAYRANLGRESLLLVSLRANGRFSGADGTFVDVAARLGTGSIGEDRIDGVGHLFVTGLVPASVAYVTLVPRSGHVRPIRIQVPEQVFAAVLPKGFGNHVAVQWHTSAGRLIRVSHESF